jgi:cyclopropane fatty-acyl-phospholipid synthase-like methyltransferase
MRPETARSWLAQIEPGGAVLDVGCGNGVPATRAMSERFHATGIDISAAQIERARENVPEARLLHGDLLAADFGEEFDAETTLELIRAAGFQVVEQAVEPQLEGERPVFFLWVLARRARLTSTP